MNLDLSTTPYQSIGYGMISREQVAESALAEWNAVGIGSTPDTEFFSIAVPTVIGNNCVADGINEVRFSSTFCGFAWGDLVALTTWFIDPTTNRVFETDVTFSSLVPINVYDGPSRLAAAGGTLFDFHRLALHEFGHAAGLAHPNEAGQSVVAVMNVGNQVVGGPQSNVDHLQPDDIAGAHAIDWISPESSATGKLDGFISGFYAQILLRLPSAAELASWRAFVQANPNPYGAAVFVHTFLDSEEYQNRPTTLSGHVTVLYRVLLGRSPDAAGLATWTSDLAARFSTILPGFINSPEFQTLRQSMDNSAFVTRLYQRVLGRTPSTTEVSGWVQYLSATGDYLGVSRGFLSSPEYLGTPRTLRDHVTILYRVFLGRDPDAAGLISWVTALISLRHADEDGFIASAEFQNHFASLFH